MLLRNGGDFLCTSLLRKKGDFSVISGGDFLCHRNCGGDFSVISGGDFLCCFCVIAINPTDTEIKSPLDLSTTTISVSVGFD